MGVADVTAKGEAAAGGVPACDAVACTFVVGDAMLAYPSTLLRRLTQSLASGLTCARYGSGSCPSPPAWRWRCSGCRALMIMVKELPVARCQLSENAHAFALVLT